MRRLFVVCAVCSGCESLLGVNECTTDADCASRGGGLACVNQLCVVPATPQLDIRCTRLGMPNGVKVASVMPLTLTDGGSNLTGVARQQALQLAVDQLNPPVRPGLRDGKPLEYFACDNQSSADTTATLAQNAISAGAIAVFTGASAETLSASRVTIPAGALLMSVSATTPELTDLPDSAPDAGPADPGLVWRTAPSDTYQGSALASEMTGDGGVLPRVAVIELNDPYGQGLYGAFAKDYAGPHDGYLYDRGGDVTSALDEAEAFTPDALLIIAFPDDAMRIINGTVSRTHLAAARLWFTDSAKSPALFSGITRSLEGDVGTAPATADPGTDAYNWFTNQYQQTFMLDPGSVSAVHSAFDAMMCVALAAHAALGQPGTPNGLSLARGLTRLYAQGAPKVALDPPDFNTGTHDLDSGGNIIVVGASGELDFDPTTGEAPGREEIWQIVDGGFVTLKVVSP